MVRRGLDSGDSLREELEGLEQMMLDFKVSCDHCQVPVFLCMSILTPFHLLLFFCLTHNIGHMYLNLQRSRRLEHEELSNEERLLNRELEVLAKHFQSWDLQAAPAPSIHTGECQSSPYSSGNAEEWPAHREIESLSYG